MHHWFRHYYLHLLLIYIFSVQLVFCTNSSCSFLEEFKIDQSLHTLVCSFLLQLDALNIMNDTYLYLCHSLHGTMKCPHQCLTTVVFPAALRPRASAAQQGPLLLPAAQEGRAQTQVGPRLHRRLHAVRHLAGADEEGRAGTAVCWGIATADLPILIDCWADCFTCENIWELLVDEASFLQRVVFLGCSTVNRGIFSLL